MKSRENCIKNNIQKKRELDGLLRKRGTVSEMEREKPGVWSE